MKNTVSTDMLSSKSKLSHHYTRGITPKRVTSDGIHLHDLAPGLHSSEETSQWWRVVGDNVSDLTGLGIAPKTDSDVFTNCANGLPHTKLT